MKQSVGISSEQPKRQEDRSTKQKLKVRFPNRTSSIIAGNPATVLASYTLRSCCCCSEITAQFFARTRFNLEIQISISESRSLDVRTYVRYMAGPPNELIGLILFPLVEKKDGGGDLGHERRRLDPALRFSRDSMEL